MRAEACGAVRIAALISFALTCNPACKPSPAIEVDVPPGAAYAALLILGPDDSVLASSRLTAWSPSGPLPIIAREGEDAVIVAYSAAQLDPLLSSKDITLRSPRGCEQKLPAPVWFAGWSAADRVDVFDPQLAPALTAEGVELACRDLTGLDPAIDLRCAEPRCAPIVERVSTCTLGLDMSSCGIGRVTATFDLDGKACLDFSATSWLCTPRDATYPASATYSCGAPKFCGLDLLTEPEGQLGTTDVLEVFPNVPDYLPRLADVSPILLTSGIDGGYLYDFHVREDSLIVAAVPDTTAREACPDDRTPGRVLFYDTETFAQTGTSTAPPCLQRLVPDPHNSGFIATYSDAGFWRIGRFDREGQLRESTALDVGLGEFRILQIEYLDSEDSVLVLAQHILEHGVFIHVFDARTLAARRIINSTKDVDGLRMAIAGPKTLVIVTGDTRLVVWLDLDTELITTTLDLPEDLSVNKDVFSVGWDAPRDQALVLARGLSNVYIAARTGRDIESALEYELDFASIASHPWPKDQGLVLIAGTEVGVWKANVAFFAPDTHRFLPGMRELGHGVVSRVREDRAGRLWLLLPWSAELVRVTPP